MIYLPGASLKLPPSLVFLVVANLVPLLGVLAWGWEVFPIMLVFWLENVIVGIFFILRILTAGAGAGRKLSSAYRSIISLFFAFHFGIFTLIHGMFVFILFSGEKYFSDGVGFSGLLSIITEYQLGWAIAALLISHAFSYISNYLINGENLGVTLSSLMTRPYLRVAILHLTILFGGFAVVVLNQPMIGLILLVLIKLVIDSWAHLVEHGVILFPFTIKSSSHRAE